MLQPSLRVLPINRTAMTTPPGQPSIILDYSFHSCQKVQSFLVFFLSFSNDQTQIQDELRLQLWNKDAAVAPNIMRGERGVP